MKKLLSGKLNSLGSSLVASPDQQQSKKNLMRDLQKLQAHRNSVNEAKTEPICEKPEFIKILQQANPKTKRQEPEPDQTWRSKANDDSEYGQAKNRSEYASKDNS